jgi:putative membrane protein
MAALEHSADWPLGAPFVVCVALAMLYGLGGRASRRVRRARVLSFYGGLLTLVLALDTPIDAYADRLFWVHMVQHVLLLTVAPPLLVLGRAWPRLWLPLPRAVRRSAARVFAWGAPLARPPAALVLLTATVGVWHVPALFNAALRRNAIHELEHLSFVVSGIVFWAAILGAPPLRARPGGVERTLYLVLAMVPAWALALVLAYSHSAFYAYADLAHRPGGISALEDQQLAAGVMWVPGSFAYLVAACWSLYAWLGSEGAGNHVRPAGQH